MVKDKKIDLMMTKEQLMKAVEQSKKVKAKYYEYWLFTEMLQEINKELMNIDYFKDLEEEKNG